RGCPLGGAVQCGPPRLPDGAVPSGGLRRQRRRKLQHRRRAASGAVQCRPGRLHVHVPSVHLSLRKGATMIRHLPRVIALMLTVGGLGPCPCRSSDAAQATLRCPATVQTGAQLATEVTVDVGMMPLGAYSVTVAYDPTVVRIASVEGGNTAEFAATPTTNADS